MLSRATTELEANRRPHTDHTGYLKFGLLHVGFGDANASVGAHLANRGLAATAWALPYHHNAFSLHYEGRNRHATYSNVLNNAHPFKEAASLQELVGLHECLILAAPADAQELYIAALEELNHLLQDTILLVIDGHNSTPLSSGRLKVKHVIESDPFRPAPKLAYDKSALNAMGMKKELEPSRSQFCHRDPSNLEPSLPEDVRSFLYDLTHFSAKVPRQESFDIPEDAYQWTAHCGRHSPEKLTLTFEKGNLVTVNGDKLPLIEAIALLNKEVGKFGHGRFVGLEPIRTDEKVLEVREAPAATIIMDAVRHLEVATLESNALDLKQYLEQKVAGKARVIPCVTRPSLPPWTEWVAA